MTENAAYLYRRAKRTGIRGSVYLLPLPVRRAAVKKAAAFGCRADADTLLLCAKVRETVWEKQSLLCPDARVLSDIYAADGDKAALLAVGGAIGKESDDPDLRAIFRAARHMELVLPKRLGKGKALYRGKVYAVFSLRDCMAAGVRLPPAVLALSLPGCRMLYAASDGKFTGFFVTRAAALPGAERAWHTLSKMGIFADLSGETDARFLPVPCEKNLQVFQKGVTMIVEKKGVRLQAKPRCTAFSRTGASPTEVTDALAFGKVLSRLCRRNAFTYALALAAALSLLRALPAAALVLLPAAYAGCAAGDLFAIAHFVPPESEITEEETMFGKIHYTMKIDGMSCAHCSARVKTALETLHGVSADVSLEEKTARIKCPASTEAETLAEAVTDAGFTVLSTERV